MRAPIFLAASLMCLIALTVGYVMLVDTQLLRGREVPASYQEFLLKNSAAFQGKVIIDSGSSSRFGLVVRTLSDYFSAPVVVAADHAAVPLRKKILRLRKYLVPGDVLLLPLEWSYYSASDRLSDIFLQGIIGEEPIFAYYTTGLPLMERLRLILRELPLRDVIDAFASPVNAARNEQVPYAELNAFRRWMSSGQYVAWGISALDGPQEKHFSLAPFSSCDQYLFFERNRRGFKPNLFISQQFRKDLALLREMNKAGIRTYLTWPVVVGSSDSACYQSGIEQRLEQYTTQIRKAVEDAGLTIIGDYRESNFPARCFLNTYYHIRQSCAPQRTKLLVDQLRAAGISPIGAGYSQNDLTRRLQQILREDMAQVGR